MLWDHPGDAHLQQEAALAWCARWAAARDAPLLPSSWSPSHGDRVRKGHFLSPKICPLTPSQELPCLGTAWASRGEGWGFWGGEELICQRKEVGEATARCHRLLYLLLLLLVPQRGPSGGQEVMAPCWALLGGLLVALVTPCTGGHAHGAVLWLLSMWGDGWGAGALSPGTGGAQPVLVVQSSHPQGCRGCSAPGEEQAIAVRGVKSRPPLCHGDGAPRTTGRCGSGLQDVPI